MKQCLRLVVWYRDQVLLQELDHTELTYDFPRAERKKGEPLRLTAKRILFLATGVKVRLSRFEPLVDWIEWGSEPHHYLVYTVRLLPKEKVQMGEGVRWFSGPKLPWNCIGSRVQQKVELALDRQLFRHVNPFKKE